MRAGEVVGFRFDVEQLAGSGGMGDVYRARDRQTGEPVALKVLQRAGEQELTRFQREAQALATVRLPGVVKYLAHGTTLLGQPYLAMEWLTGETLAERLARDPLTTAESVTLGLRVATTLGVVHRLGIVHRDLKPSNLLLVDGQIERVTLIDFGLARVTGVEHQLTVPGAILGTPAYMAPEQARGKLAIDARVDVFALGCVLFKCLTGRAVFQGAGGLAVLAKVILEEPPRLRDLREDIPEPLDQLVARMLSKHPAGRPAHGDAVAAELAELQGTPLESGASRPSAASVRPSELTTGERKVMCLVLARDAPAEGATRVEESERAEALSTIAKRCQGDLEMLDGRSPLIVLSGAIAPTDLAARAARCALALRDLLGRAPVALVTGRAEISARLPVGDVIDRAAEMLESGDDAGSIRIDEVTAGLLGARFDIVEGRAGRLLRGAREEADATPQLLGKATACVGRDRELGLLVAEFGYCVEESAATAIVVTGAAGMGKSRLRRELVHKLQAQGEAVEVWIGQADPMSAGSAFSLLAHALRRGIGLIDGEPLEARCRKVRARVERHARAGLDVPRVAAFLGELVGAPFPDAHDVQLRAARRNPMLMGDQLRLAWEEFLHAECATRPVLLVLEDLHWGDLPTVNLVDAALRHLKEMPFMVLALSRPEVRELFPKLWEGRRGHEVRLTPLPRRASERLVRQVLGDRVSPELVDMLVQRADGNAFYLEEQIRAVAGGKTSGLPETVLAMVQAGLEGLDPETRRVLRAASIFGETFSPSGVAALVGELNISHKLVELRQREVIVRGGSGAAGSGGEAFEYRFRHALVREAAYGMLTERDRQIGHALAGAFLETLGDADPMALAEHFERGGEPARAATAYLRAAQQALRGNDLRAAIERAERGIACGAEPAVSGALRLAEAEAHRWRGEFALAEQRGLEAMGHLEVGSAAWFSAVSQVVIAAGKLGHFEQVERWTATAREATAREAALIAKNLCLGEGALYLSFGGRYAAADALLEAIVRTQGDRSALDIEVIARVEPVLAFRAQASDLGASLERREAALAAFEQAGDRRNACMARTNVGYLYGELGDFEGAEGALRAALSAAKRMDLPNVVASVLNNLGPVLAHRGQRDEARRVEESAIAMFQQLGDPRMVGGSRIYLATILLLSGDLDAAEREARAAAELLHKAPPLLAHAVAVRGRALLGLGRTAEALAEAEQANALLMEVGAEEGESLVRSIRAEALAALGRRAEAAEALASARDNLLERAGRISDPLWRERFLHNVPDNARILELSRAWLRHVT